VWHLCGTSFSTPFAAGVAALVWAANPELTGPEVWNLMESSLQGGRWPRVNALDAVAAALGPFTGVRFVEPEAGSEHDLNRAVGLAAMVTIPTDPTVYSARVRIRFVSDRDGLLDDQTWTVPMEHGEVVSRQRVSTVATSLSEGSHVITVTANHAGADSTDTLRLTVSNSPPSDLRITRPAEGAEFCIGSPVVLRGDAFDINEQLGLPESAFRWRSDRDGLLATGRNATATGLSAGAHRITLRVTDSGGLSAGKSVTIRVLAASDAACVDLPPEVRITTPDNRSVFYVDDLNAETGRDEHGAYIVVTVRVSVSDDHDDLDDLRRNTDVYVRPEWPDTWAGSGTRVDVRLHLQDGVCSQPKVIEVIVYDSAGNRSEDSIEVFVNRFC